MRKINFDRIAEHYFKDGQIKKIKNAKIGIAGAGGLGSNCALNLVRCGFINFTICDFDVVEIFNLNRQFYFASQIGMNKIDALKENLLKINAALKMEIFKVRLTNENIKRIYKKCHVVIEAFDKAECKSMIVQSFLNSGKLLVSVSGIGGYGNSDRIRTRKIRQNFYLIGDGKSGVGQDVKPYAPCVSIAAAKQADVVLRWVLKE